MKDNIIYNDRDETIGYYNDLYKMFSNLIKEMLDGRNVDGVKEQLEYLDEMSEYANYEGLLVLSMNNGMGFTCKPYVEENK